MLKMLVSLDTKPFLRHVADDDKMLEVKQKFESLFSTIVWFVEQDPYTNVAMNLEVNYCKVKQDNYFVLTPTGKDFHTALMEIGGTTFQNSQIHLLFYERSVHKSNQAILKYKVGILFCKYLLWACVTSRKTFGAMLIKWLIRWSYIWLSMMLLLSLCQRNSMNSLCLFWVRNQEMTPDKVVEIFRLCSIVFPLIVQKISKICYISYNCLLNVITANLWLQIGSTSRIFSHVWPTSGVLL